DDRRRRGAVTGLRPGRQAPSHSSARHGHRCEQMTGERSEHEWLAERFEEHRRRLRAVAYRMLGSLAESDDAVQEAWLRLSRQDAGSIQNLGAWLTTVVARVCLNVLQTRAARREEP